MNISMSNAEKWEACTRDDRMQSFKWLAIIGIVLLSALIQSRNANASEIKHSEGVSNNAALCATFRKQLSLHAPNGLIRFRIDESAFSDIDVTGGNLSSLLEGSCSLSREPADPCSLSYEVFPKKRIEHTFDLDERFYLAKYKKRIFAITTKVNLKKRVGHHKIYHLDASGVRLICSNI